MPTFPGSPTFPPTAAQYPAARSVVDFSGQPFPRLASVNGLNVPSNLAGALWQRFHILICHVKADPSSILAGQPAPGILALGFLAFHYTSSNPSARPTYIQACAPYDGWWLCNPGSTLAGSIGTGDTTLAVASASNFSGYTTPFPIRVDTEVMTVTTVSGTTLTLTRGVSTPSASHTAGALVRPLNLVGVNAATQWNINQSNAAPHDPNQYQRDGTTPNYRYGMSPQDWASYYITYAYTQMAPAQAGIFADNFTLQQLTTAPNTTNAIETTPASQSPYGPNIADCGDGWTEGEMHILQRLRARNPGSVIGTNRGFLPGLCDVAEIEFWNEQDSLASPWYSDGGQSSFFKMFPVALAMDAAAPATAGPTCVWNGSPQNTSGGVFAAVDLPALRVSTALSCLHNGAVAFDANPTHGTPWQFDEWDQAAGSCLASSINTSTTTITLVAGGGSQFSVGQVVYCPNDGTTGILGDEQWYISNIATDTLTVVRGYNGSTADTHAARQKVFTRAQVLAGKGWLGTALTATTQLTSTSGGNLLTNGTFESWTGYLPTGWGKKGGNSGTIYGPDATVHQQGSWSFRAVTYPTPINGGGSGLWASSQLLMVAQTVGTSLTASTDYTFSIYAKADLPQYPICVQVRRTSDQTVRYTANLLAFTSWTQLSFSFTSGYSEQVDVWIGICGKRGTLWLDNAGFYAGNPNLYSRDFAGGRVYLNMTNAAQSPTVAAGAGGMAGSNFAKLAGSQDTTTNSGVLVTTGGTVTIPAQDALFLRRV